MHQLSALPKKESSVVLETWGKRNNLILPYLERMNLLPTIDSKNVNSTSTNKAIKSNPVINTSKKPKSQAEN